MAKRRGQPVHGWVNLNKPRGVSSAKALAIVKRVFNAAKAGHGGTLDPTATGVLLVCLGRATKLFDALQIGTKTYEATILFGITTDSFDTSGKILTRSAADHITIEQIEQSLGYFRGQIQQTVPMFSAIKRKGQPLYKMARKGIRLDKLPTRQVEIDHLELLSEELSTHNVLPEVKISVVCSKGTYIRSLVSDIGHKLGCGAVLSQLNRTSSGIFHLSGAHTIDQLRGKNSIENEIIIPFEQASQMLGQYREQISSFKK